jgi:DNA polymerase-3 subunit gamma/tau
MREKSKAGGRPFVVLARKYRPQRFEELVGQEAIASALKQAVASGQTGQAYLFCGPRGVGKTSTARILAKCLNCLKGQMADPCGSCEPCRLVAEGADLDVVEIDGASNNRVEEIRELRENAVFSPARCRYRIYLIDEVHMLSLAAFNALLKILEEPPGHVKFIFATTQPQKVLPTVRSRCQRFDFRRIPPEAIRRRLEEVCAAEGIRAAPEGLDQIARRAEGGMRDALVLLDQLASFCEGEIGPRQVVELLGIFPPQEILALLEETAAGRLSEVLGRLDRIWEGGQNLTVFAEQLAEELEAVLRARLAGKETALAGRPLEWILRVLDLLSELRRDLTDDVRGRIRLELFLVKVARAEASAGEAREESGARAAQQEIRTDSGRGAGKVEIEKGARSAEVGAQREKKEAGSPGPSSGDPAGKWGELLERVKQKKRSVAAFLCEGKPVEVTSEHLAVAFSPEHSFHFKQMEQVSHRELVEECLREVLGGSLKLRCVLSAAGEREEESAEPQGKGEEGASASVPHLVRRTAEIFEGRVLR